MKSDVLMPTVTKMTDHSELVAELPLVEKMSTHDRLKHAKKRRTQQLKRFHQYDKQQGKENKKKKNNNNKKNNKKKRLSKVHFVNNVMLLEAAARNDVEEVRNLLQDGVSPDVTNEDGLTALHQCCIDDSEEMMKLLIEYGANVNAMDSELWTPLHAAATCGHLHLCKYLVEKGAELLSVNADGNMPYDICEDEVTLDYIESEMAKRGVTQELIDETRLSTENKMLTDVKSTAAQNKDLEFRGRYGETPLHIAAANGYVQVAEFLLDHHVSVDATDDDSWQPIHAAACWGHLPILELLVQNGADLEAKTKTGESPLDICEDLELKQRLMELKDEIESNRATQTVELRHRKSSNTRSRQVPAVPANVWSPRTSHIASSVTNSGTNLYSSNNSLAGAHISASVRRTSMREKSAISWKEAREEARLRGSTSDDVGVTENGHSDEVLEDGGGECLPMSNIDEVNISLTDSVDTIEEESPEPLPPQPSPIPPATTPTPTLPPTPTLTPTPPTNNVVISEREPPSTDSAKSSDRVSSRSSDRPVEVPKSYETNGLHPQQQTPPTRRIAHHHHHHHHHPGEISPSEPSTPPKPAPPSSLSGSNRDLRSLTATPPGGTASPAPTAGTLSDLKRHRAQMLQNALRARDPAYQSLNSTTDSHLGALSNSTASLHSQTNSVLPASEQNGHSPSLSESRSNSTGPSPFIPTVPLGDPPKKRFTATSPSEVIGGDDGKQNCCVIL